MKRLAIITIFIMGLTFLGLVGLTYADGRKPGEPIVEKGLEPANFDPKIPAFQGWVSKDWINETNSSIKPIDKPMDVYISFGEHDGHFIYNWKRVTLPEKSMVLFRGRRATHLPYMGCLIYPANEGLDKSPEGGYAPWGYNPDLPAFTGNPPKCFLMKEDLSIKPLKEDTVFFVSQKLKNGRLTWERKILKKGTMMVVTKYGTFTHKDKCGNLVYPAKDGLKPLFCSGYDKLSKKLDEKFKYIIRDIDGIKEDIVKIEGRVQDLEEKEDKGAEPWLKWVAVAALILAVLSIIIILILFITGTIGGSGQAGQEEETEEEEQPETEPEDETPPDEPSETPPSEESETTSEESEETPPSETTETPEEPSEDEGEESPETSEEEEKDEEKPERK